MSTIAPRRLAGKLTIIAASAIGSVVVIGVGAGVLALLITGFGAGGGCAAPAGDGAGSIALGPPGTGQLVGASEYGGPGDPGSGHVGASGADLLAHPDSYAELGGDTFQTATAMGGLPYMTALRVTWQAHSAIAYKRDFGFGGGPVAGLTRVIDLWWRLAVALRIPYQDGLWSGAVRIERPPDTGAGHLLEQTPGAGGALLAPGADVTDPVICAPGALAGRAADPGPARAVVAQRPGGGARGRAGGGAGDHRRGQPDRGQAVPLRRRTRPGAGSDRAGL